MLNSYINFSSIPLKINKESTIKMLCVSYVKLILQFSVILLYYALAKRLKKCYIRIKILEFEKYG